MLKGDIKEIELARWVYEANIDTLGRRLRWFRVRRRDTESRYFKRFLKDMVVIYRDIDIARDGYNYIVWASHFDIIPPASSAPLYELIPRLRRIRFGRKAGDGLLIGFMLIETEQKRS